MLLLFTFSSDSIVIPLEQGLRLENLLEIIGEIFEFYRHSIRTRIKTKHTTDKQ